MQIITQDAVTIEPDTLNKVVQCGPFNSFGEAASAVRKLVGATRLTGLSDHSARQITTELLAQGAIELDDAARQIAANAHLTCALNGDALHPALSIRLIERAPYQDAVSFEIALEETVKAVYGVRALGSLTHALADDMISDGTVDISPLSQKAA